jgi:hypothetical protein
MKTFTGIIGLVFLLTGLARAVINPSLQPGHLAERYNAVVACRVTGVDSRARTITLAVENVATGEFAPKTVIMKAAKEDMLDTVLAVEKGQLIVAYVGKKQPKSRHNDILYYVGGGKWFIAQLASATEPERWELLADADANEAATSGKIMFATFNGRVESLWEMMVDGAAGRGYFPAVPFTRFRAQEIATLDKPIYGVAIFDVNGDGKLDLFACSAAGNRLFIQRADGTFSDETKAFGLTGIASRSCSFAGGDLLLDGRLYIQTNGKFVASDRVPPSEKVLSSAFVEINGDGWPDVVVSREGKGLAIFLNPGKPDAKFTESFAMPGTGYFDAGDWNGDGRTDLIYLTGPGYVLTQQGDGQFKSATIGDEGDDLGLGTAAFGAIARADQPGAFLVFADAKRLIENNGGAPADVTRFGNEIQDPIAGLLMAIAEDLNADGTLDLYAAGPGAGTQSLFLNNRGYGSFMMEEKYRGGKIVPPGVYNAPAWGLAAGDVTGDGANDLLVGGDNGRLTLLINETLTDRKPEAGVSTPQDERKQIQTHIVTLRFSGKTGALGSQIVLLDAKQRVVARRQIGGNIGMGCAGPSQTSLAVRDPGDYTLRVRFGDGTSRDHKFSLTATSPRHQTLIIKEKK